jgi:hypothetical protein
MYAYLDAEKKRKSMPMPKPKLMPNDAAGDELTMYAYLNAEKKRKRMPTPKQRALQLCSLPGVFVACFL